MSRAKHPLKTYCDPCRTIIAFNGNLIIRGTTDGDLQDYPWEVAERALKNQNSRDLPSTDDTEPPNPLSSG